MSKQSATFQKNILFIGWVGLLACVALIAWPGLYGSFYFDDWPNLSSLEEVKKSGHWLLFVWDGVTGSIGRPVSLLTFAMQADAWPSDPFQFKQVNLLIHLLNSALVGLLGWQILQLLGNGDSLRTRILATLAMSLWALHPLHASTIFYVVQRMTLLSATFTLIAVIAYFQLRMRNVAWGWREYTLATFVCGFGYLGVLAKENAILLGAFILVLEMVIRSSARAYFSPARWWLFLIAWVPLLVTLLYLLVSGKVFQDYGGRDFSLFERLITQAVVLWDYVSKIVLPTPKGLNLYNDDFPVFRSLWSPVVLVSLIAWGVVLTAAVKLRKSSPLFAFAVLWFVAGHLLESTIVPLEIYFEHRNYIPSIGILIALVAGLYRSIEWLKAQNRWLAVGGAILGGGYLFFIVSTMGIESRIWGDPKAFAVAAISDRPDSLRARQEAAAFFYSQGDIQTTAALLYSINEDFQEYAGTYAQLLLLKCRMPELSLPDDDYIRSFMTRAPEDRGADDALHELWVLKKSGACDEISWSRFRSFLDALLANPQFNLGRENFVLLKAFSYGEEGAFSEASDQMQLIPDNVASLSFLLIKARMEAMAEKIDDSASTLSYIKNQRLNNPVLRGVYGGIVDDLRNKVQSIRLESRAIE